MPSYRQKIVLAFALTLALLSAVRSDCQNEHDAAILKAQEDGHPMVGVLIAACEADGSYKAMQCNPSTGFCWCVNTKTGEKIPGSELRGLAPDCSAAPFGPIRNPVPGPVSTTGGEGPSTKCRAERDSILASNDNQHTHVDYLPVCDTKGLYMSRQCSNATATCWCVQKKTGERINGTEKPQSQGKPKCSKRKQAQASDPSAASTTPATSTTLPTSVNGVCKSERDRALAQKGVADRWIHDCDDDGNYVPLQCYGFTHTCYCADVLTGQRIPGTDGTEDNKPNCTQAGSRPGWCKTVADKQRKDPDPYQWIMDCDEEGNFKPLQCNSQTIGNVCFCVDRISGVELPGTEGSVDNKPNCATTVG